MLTRLRPWIGFAAGAALFALAAAGEAADKIKFNMSWLPQGSVGGILVGIDKGYYKEAGIEVQAVRGFGGLRTVNEIDQGQFEFGYGNPVGVVLNRAKGGNTRMIGTINSRWPAGLCYVKERHNPKTLADLKGFTIGGGPGSPVQVVLPAWLEMNGLPRDHIKVVTMEPAVIDAALIEGKTDLAECWLASSWPPLRAQAKAAGKTVDWIEYRKHGLDIYGSGLTTTDKIINEKSDLVRRFVKATYKGYEYMQKDPAGSAAVIVKLYPTLLKEIVLEQVQEINDLIIDPAVRDKGLGWQTEERMQKTADFINKVYKVEKPIKAADTYTNKFLAN